MIAIGSDHAGFILKKEIINYLQDNNYNYQDFGTFKLEPVDTADIALSVAEKIVEGEFSKGILICGSGIGMSIAANKVPGIRAVLATDPYMARTSREHNNTNVLCLGARVIGRGLAEEIVATWLTTEFDNQEKRIRRLNKIKEIEKKYSLKSC